MCCADSFSAASAALSRTHQLNHIGRQKTLCFGGGEEAAPEKSSAGGQSPSSVARMCPATNFSSFSALLLVSPGLVCVSKPFLIFPRVESSSFSNSSLVITHTQTTAFKASLRGRPAGTSRSARDRQELGAGGGKRDPNIATRLVAGWQKGQRDISESVLGLKAMVCRGELRIQALFPTLGMQQEAERPYLRLGAFRGSRKAGGRRGCSHPAEGDKRLAQFPSS